MKYFKLDAEKMMMEVQAVNKIRMSKLVTCIRVINK